MIKVIEDNSYLAEMAKLGDFEEYRILVWSDDPGNIPHFHFINKSMNSSSKSNESCIRFDKPDYFPHGGKDMVLNASERKKLMKILSDINEEDDTKTNWEMIVILWNMNNSKRKLDKKIKMPDYRKLR